MVTVWWSAAGLIHYSFLNPGETFTSVKYAQQINETQWKLQYLQPALIKKKGPILFHNNTQPHFKSWTNWTMRFCLICHIHLTSHQLPLLQASWQLFAGKIYNQQDAENAFQEFLKSWNTNFYATGINKLISHWQTCADFKKSGYMYMYNQFILLYSWN